MKNKLQIAATAIGLVLIFLIFAGITATAESTTTSIVQQCPEGQRPIGWLEDGTLDCVNESVPTTPVVESTTVVVNIIDAAEAVKVQPSFTG